MTDDHRPAIVREADSLDALAQRVRNRERKSRKDQLAHAKAQAVDVLAARQQAKRGEWGPWCARADLSFTQAWRYAEFGKVCVTKSFQALSEDGQWAVWQRISGNGPTQNDGPEEEATPPASAQPDEDEPGERPAEAQDDTAPAGPADDQDGDADLPDDQHAAADDPADDQDQAGARAHDRAADADAPVDPADEAQDAAERGPEPTGVPNPAEVAGAVGTIRKLRLRLCRVLRDADRASLDAFRRELDEGALNRARDFAESLRKELERLDRELFQAGREKTYADACGRLDEAFDSAAPPADTLAVLGLVWPCSAEDVKAAYHRLAREWHPDRGGTDEAMRELTDAYEAVLAMVRGEDAHAD
jgi:hypothetical protein